MVWFKTSFGFSGVTVFGVSCFGSVVCISVLGSEISTAGSGVLTFIGAIPAVLKNKGDIMKRLSFFF